ncbi:MAG: hypothetical protein ACI9XZ_004588, partial [Alphaproteobacteria bacterium]
ASALPSTTEANGKNCHRRLGSLPDVSGFCNNNACKLSLIAEIRH